MNHISIEGMDGVGKTTTCRLLSEKLGYKFIEKPLHYLFDDSENDISRYQRIARDVNANPNRDFTSMFYGLGSIYMYGEFKDQNIITDRHLASNYAWSGTEDNIDVYDLLVRKLGAPRLTIILYSPSKTIIERLKDRNKKDKDIERVKHSENIYKRMIEFCKKYKFPYVLIDTSKLTVEEVVNQIAGLVKYGFK